MTVPKVVDEEQWYLRQPSGSEVDDFYTILKIIHGEGLTTKTILKFLHKDRLAKNKSQVDLEVYIKLIYFVIIKYLIFYYIIRVNLN